MLQCCEQDGEIYLFLSFFAVGVIFRALICNALKGGGILQLNFFSNIFRLFCYISALIFLNHFFITHFTLSKIYDFPKIPSYSYSYCNEVISNSTSFLPSLNALAGNAYIIITIITIVKRIPTL